MKDMLNNFYINRAGFLWIKEREYKGFTIYRNDDNNYFNVRDENEQHFFDAPTILDALKEIERTIELRKVLRMMQNGRHNGIVE